MDTDKSEGKSEIPVNFMKDTYAFAIVRKILDKHNMKYTATKHPHFGFPFNLDGCRVQFETDKREATPYALSVQTCPSITGPALCETALFKDGKICYDDRLDYCDVIRHSTPEEFEDHILDLVKNLKDLTNIETNL